MPLNEILSGGAPKDGIPAIDQPNFDPVPDADKWLQAQEPVILFERARRAPILCRSDLAEIANDTVAGIPVAVTYAGRSHSPSRER